MSIRKINQCSLTIEGALVTIKAAPVERPLDFRQTVDDNISIIKTQLNAIRTAGHSLKDKLAAAENKVTQLEDDHDAGDGMTESIKTPLGDIMYSVSNGNMLLTEVMEALGECFKTGGGIPQVRGMLESLSKRKVPHAVGQG